MSYIIIGADSVPEVSGVQVAVGPFPDRESAIAHLHATRTADPIPSAASTLVPLTAPIEHLRLIEPKGAA